MDIPAKSRTEPPPCAKCSLPTINIPAQQVNPPVESSLEYIPYEKTIVEMEPYERKEMVPKEIWVTEYETVKRKALRKVERTVTDYITIEYVTEFVEDPQHITRTEMVPQQIIENVVRLIPVERSIVHYPNELANRPEPRPLYPESKVVPEARPVYVPESRPAYVPEPRPVYVPEPKPVYVPQVKPNLADTTYDDLKQSVLYNPTPPPPPPPRRSGPVLYSAVGKTPITFDAENKDTVVFQNMADGSSPETTAPGADATAKPLNAGPNQRFKLLNKGNSYSVFNPATRTNLDLGSLTPTVGSKAKFNPQSGAPTQNWYLDMVDGTMAKLRNTVDPEPVLGRDKWGQLQLQEDEDLKSQLWNVVGLQILGQY